MLTTLAGKHWTKMKLPPPAPWAASWRGHLSKCHLLYSAVTTWTTISDPFAVRHVFPWGGGLCISPSLCREVSVLKPSCDPPSPNLLVKSPLKRYMPQIGQPYLGPLPLNLFLFSPSSWLIPSLTRHDTNSLYLFSFSWSPSPHI